MERRTLIKTLFAGMTGSILATGTARGTPKPRSAATGAFVEIGNDTRLFVRDWGNGNPLVFAAPWALHSDWWEYQTAFLTENGRRCVSYDRRGHGKSTESRSGYDFDTLAADLNAVIESLDLHGVTLVGQSMGCGEIVRYLTCYGSRRVARLVLIAPATPFLLKTVGNPDGFDPAFLEKVRTVLRTDRPRAISMSAPGFFGSPANSVTPEMCQWWIDMMLSCPLKVMLELHKMYTVTDFRGELRALRLGTAIIQGDNDTSTPLDMTGRQTAALIPDSDLIVYENAAHGLPISHMDRLNNDLLRLTTA